LAVVPSQRTDERAADRIQQSKAHASDSQFIEVIELVSDDEADIETIECPLCGSVLERNMLDQHLQVKYNCQNPYAPSPKRVNNILP
jgi:hypothetical protein